MGSTARPVAVMPAQGCGEEGARAKPPLCCPNSRTIHARNPAGSTGSATRLVPESWALQLTSLVSGAKSPELQVLGELEEEQPGFPGTGDEASLRAETGRLS